MLLVGLEGHSVSTQQDTPDLQLEDMVLLERLGLSMQVKLLELIPAAEQSLLEVIFGKPQVVAF